MGLRVVPEVEAARICSKQCLKVGLPLLLGDSLLQQSALGLLAVPIEFEFRDFCYGAAEIFSHIFVALHVLQKHCILRSCKGFVGDGAGFLKHCCQVAVDTGAQVTRTFGWGLDKNLCANYVAVRGTPTENHIAELLDRAQLVERGLIHKLHGNIV